MPLLAWTLRADVPSPTSLARFDKPRYTCPNHADKPSRSIPLLIPSTGRAGTTLASSCQADTPIPLPSSHIAPTSQTAPWRSDPRRLALPVPAEPRHADVPCRYEPL